MQAEFQKELSEIDNSIKMIACSQPTFIKVLGTILRKQTPYNLELVEHTLSKLCQKDFQLYRGILVEPRRISPLIKACLRIEQVALLLKEHQEYIERSGYDYGEEMFDIINQQIGLLIKESGEENRQFLCVYVDEFYSFKKLARNGGKWTKIDRNRKEEIDRRIYLMAEFVVAPLLAFYGHKINKHFYQPILAKWLLFLSSTANPHHNKLIYELSKRLISICSPMNQLRPPLAQSFCLMMNFCEVEYHNEELFTVADNLGLFLNYINPNIIPELTRTWMRGLRNTEGDLYVNVCENLVEASVTVNSLRIIQTISNQLKQNCDFGALEKIYQKVIKKKLAKCTFKREGTLIIFLDLVIFFVVGFINTQRIDDELQSIILNYQNNILYSPAHQLQTTSYKLKLLLSICHYYFRNLTNNSRNVSRQLTKLYCIKLSDLVQLRVQQYVMNNRFPVDFNQHQDQTYQLQASSRYVGIANIGNTCYMNAYLQAMHMTKNFRNMFEDIEWEVASTSSKVSVVLSELFHQLTKRTQDIHPFKLKSVLEEPFRSSTEQQDSAEFGRSLLQQLNLDFSNTLFEETFLSIFNTTINKIMSCTKCGLGSNQLGTSKNMIMPLGENNEPIFISEILKKMFVAEQLGRDDKVFCPRCQVKQEYYVKEIPEFFSSCLTFALNRFEFDKGQKQFIKKFNPINFQFQIDLSYSVPNLNGIHSVYELYAFIVHIGVSPHGGHYITYARNITENPNLWYTFDDNYVTEKEVLTFADFHLGEYDSPYILFYSSQTNKPVVARGLSKISMKKGPSGKV